MVLRIVTAIRHFLYILIHINVAHIMTSTLKELIRFIVTYTTYN